MKISFIATVLNEGKTVSSFVDSILNQTEIPDEVIIVDGGSIDRTVANIKNKKILQRIKFKIIKKKGNRAVGRNEAINQTSGDIVVCSDAGCILDKNWVKNIIEPFRDPDVDVVAGYYEGIANNVFQKCLIPYVLIMEDRIDPEKFLPASRSMAFRKSIWKKVGGFDERYSHNEDYVFAKKLKKEGMKIFFQKKAIVYWTPGKNLKEAFVMFFRFAYGDIESGILRPKVLFLFFRYILGLILLLVFIFTKSVLVLDIIFVCLASYIIWSIFKSCHYINSNKTLFILPLLQFTADLAVSLGTLIGLAIYIRTRFREI